MSQAQPLSHLQLLPRVPRMMPSPCWRRQRWLRRLTFATLPSLLTSVSGDNIIALQVRFTSCLRLAEQVACTRPLCPMGGRVLLIAQFCRGRLQFCLQSICACAADHGKTTLVDAMLKQSKVFRDNQAVQVRFMQDCTCAGLDGDTTGSGTKVGIISHTRQACCPIGRFNYRPSTILLPASGGRLAAASQMLGHQLNCPAPNRRSPVIRQSGNICSQPAWLHCRSV